MAACSTRLSGSSLPVKARRNVVANAFKPIPGAGQYATTSVSSPVVLYSNTNNPYNRPKSLEAALVASCPVGPELINGRLAMLGAAGALANEMTTHESIATQFGHCWYGVVLIVAAMTYATVTPLMKGVDMREAFGPFSPLAEKMNGRFAMIGLTLMILIENATGHAIF